MARPAPAASSPCPASCLPEDRFGQVEIGGGSYGTANADFDFGGKIDDDGKFSVRLDGYARRSDTEISHSLAERYGVSLRRHLEAGRQDQLDPALHLPEGSQGRRLRRHAGAGLAPAQPERPDPPATSTAASRL